jgi:hydroxyacylglutathione hydrolase
LIVEQIWTGNAWRNFNYLVVCPAAGEALAVDPLDYEKCLAKAKDNGWTITHVLNTHEHGDHTGGNQAMIEATGARLMAHHEAEIPGIDIPLSGGSVIRLGSTVEFEVLDTPGHTMSHLCLLSHTDEPALFSGDTLFNAGAGNCHNGGHPGHLFESFAQQLSILPDNTRVYPGHDYWASNLAFTLDREPDNEKAIQLLGREDIKNPGKALISTLGLERDINTFFRLQNPRIIAALRASFPDLSENPDSREVFLKLRELRNRW